MSKKEKQFWLAKTNPEIYLKRDDWPKLSIVTPSYNQGEFLEKAILSVLNQNYPNLEYIIIDGGSADNTLNIIKKYNQKIDYWVSEEDQGQADAINKGLQRSSGELIGWLNSDDYLLPKALYNLASAYLENNKKNGAYLGRGHKVNRDNERIYSPDPQKVNLKNLIRWMEGNNFMQPACYWTRGVMDTIGFLNEKWQICMDLEYWIRISSAGFPFIKVDKDIAHAHIHEEAKTTKEKGIMVAETLFMLSHFDESYEYAIPKIKDLYFRAEEGKYLKNKFTKLPFGEMIYRELFDRE